MPQPQGDREWSHWPGRRQADDGIRHRLRSLFSATDTPADEVEALIAERSKELHHRTEQLAATISDLERREENTRRLRIAVEEMLRRGSTELDERHAELNALAAELGSRLEQISAAELGVEERRRELGAVELRRAAVERRELAATERESAVAAVAAQLAAREAALEDREAASSITAVPERAAVEASPEREATVAEQHPDHVRVVPLHGYKLQQAAGPAPAPGTDIEIDGQPFRVLRTGPSPLPGDRRRCAFLELVWRPGGS